MQNRCLRRPDKESTDVIHRYFDDCTSMKNTESHGMRLGGENTIILYDRMALETHFCVVTRAQRIQKSKHRILTANSEGGTLLNNHSINDPTFLKRKKTCRQLRQDRRPTRKQLRHRRQRGTQPSGRRAIGILSILQALTTGEHVFSVLGQVSVAWRKTSSQPTGV